MAIDLGGMSGVVPGLAVYIKLLDVNVLYAAGYKIILRSPYPPPPNLDTPEVALAFILMWNSSMSVKSGGPGCFGMMRYRELFLISS